MGRHMDRGRGWGGKTMGRHMKQRQDCGEVGPWVGTWDRGRGWGGGPMSRHTGQRQVCAAVVPIS